MVTPNWLLPRTPSLPPPATQPQGRAETKGYDNRWCRRPASQPGSLGREVPASEDLFKLAAALQLDPVDRLTRRELGIGVDRCWRVSSLARDWRPGAEWVGGAGGRAGSTPRTVRSPHHVGLRPQPQHSGTPTMRSSVECITASPERPRRAAPRL